MPIIHKSNYAIGPTEVKVLIFVSNYATNLIKIKKVILKIRPILFEEKQTSLFETVKVLDRESLIMRSRNQQDHVKNLEKYIFHSPLFSLENRNSNIDKREIISI